MTRWLQAMARLPWGLLLVAAGVVLLVLGWYGVSGQPTVAQQMPYFASATIPGAMLVIAGAIVVGAGILRGGRGNVDRMIADLHTILLEAATPDPGEMRGDSGAPQEQRQRFDGDELVAVEGGTLVHRASCALVAGKATAHRVTPDDVAARGLRPCPVCAG